MRVGIDVRAALLSRTGIARYVTELTAALGALAAPELDLVLFGDSLAAAQNEPGRLAARSGGRLVRARLPGRLYRTLGRLGVSVEARTGRLDVFHHTDLVFVPVRRARTVVTVHDVAFDVDRRFHGADFRRDVPGRLAAALAGAAAVVVPSAETGRQVVARYGVAEERITVVPHGADHARVAADPAAVQDAGDLLRARGAAGPVILCVGTLEPRKNHLRLLAAFDRFAREHPHVLVLAGGFGWLCDDVRARLAAAPKDRVVHLPAADDRLLAALHAVAEFTVYPSLYEGFGLPVLESMARGVPVLTTRRGALPEVGGDAVEECDPEDVLSIERGLARLAGDPARRQELAARGTARAAAFTWRRSAAAHLAIYRAAAEEPPSRG